MRASYIQGKGDRRTRCKGCDCLRPVRTLVNGYCGRPGPCSPAANPHEGEHGIGCADCFAYLEAISNEIR
jgi:hypothetical protein